MFTVIIAEKGIVDLFKKFNMFLAPLFDKDIAFCEWNREGESLEEMLPTLYETIALQNSWRAIIVNQDGLEKVNPFDYTEYSEEVLKTDYTWDELVNRREARFSCYEKAARNPLTKLSMAFAGIPSFRALIQSEELYQGIVTGEYPIYQYMLDSQMQAIQLSETASHILQYDGDRLRGFVQENQVEELIECLKSGDSNGILSLLQKEDILEFIRLIGDYDPFFSDPELVECKIENKKKQKLYETISEKFRVRDKDPEEIICVALRTYDVASYEQEVKWKENDESKYSNFAEFNLYHDKLKYLLFDIVSEDNKQYAADQIRLLCFLLVLAGNTVPQGALSNKRVYRTNIEFENDSIGKISARYINKMRATLRHIRELDDELQIEEGQEIDNFTSQEIFESEIVIPIEINSEYQKDNLYARYRGIGLSKDCPHDEVEFWDEQYHSIGKLFVRYLREPRRAVKMAVKEEFHIQSKINDARAALLSEYQKEDVEFKLLEEEQSMMETSTTQLFNTSEYNRRLNEADKELRRGIGQRMTRKKTLIFGLVSLIAYLIGFIPMFVSNVNTANSFAISLILAGIALGAFLIIGIICLYSLRRKLINRFKHFNFVISGICDEIDKALQGFSEYLSHACNVMREFSVLNYSNKAMLHKHNVLKKHELDIVKKTEEISRIFSEHIKPSMVDSFDEEAFDYNFALLREYEYDLQYQEIDTKIEFIQPGHEITIPVDYVKAITITREELYD